MLLHPIVRRSTFLNLLLVLIATCFAQNASAQGSPTAQHPAATQSQPAAESETEGADIPPFARGLISEKDYFALRDQEIRIRRGTDDLLRNPQARSQAVRKMQFMEQVLRTVPQGLTPFSALIPNAAAGTWTPLGPDPIPNGQTDPTGNPANEKPVSGRVTAIAVDPTTDQTVYVGTAQGGLYRSLDGGATWTALMDSAQSLAIGALAIDPLNRDTLFVGTGEGNLSGDSFFGVGVYIIRSASTATPVLSGPFNAPVLPNPDGFADVFTGRSITQILVNPADDNRILVSTSSGVSGLSSDVFSTLPTRGVYLSTNAQATTPTFTRLTIQTGAANEIVTDMAMDPGNPDLVAVHVFGLAAAADGGVWVSTTSPWAGTGTWQHTLSEVADNGKFAVNRSGTPTPTTTFLLALDNSVVTACGAGRGGSVFKSTDGGQNWPELAAARGFCGGQCFYDAVPAMSPGSPNTIFLGGPFDSTTTPAVEACGSSVFARSIDGGTTFTRNDKFLHPDSHAFVFAPSNPSIVYTGNDGGIFRSADGGLTWTSINTAGFNATQFMSLSVHPTDPTFSIGGTQDNGTELRQSDGTWTRADFGDGGYSAIDQSATSTTNVTMYHTYFNVTSKQIAFTRVTSAAAATEGNWTFIGCNGGTNGNGITCTDNTLFYAPLALGPGTPNTVYFGTDHLYRSANQGTANTVVSQLPFAGTDPVNNGNPRITAIGISPQDDNVRIVGLTTGHVFATTTGANPMTDVTGPWAAKFIARAVIDPNNKATAYVTLDGYGTPTHIWKTTSLAGEPATPTWTPVSAGLPDVPVNAFVIDPANSNSLYAGTDIGVFNSTDGGLTWLPFGTGLPRVAVFDLNMQKSSRTIRIGTHGRGAWEIAAANVPIAPDYSINASNGTATVLAGQPASFTFTITPQGGFAGTIAFTCAGLPTASTCTFNPTTVTASGSTTLTITTTARSVALAKTLSGPTLAALTTFGFVGIFFLGGSRKKSAARVACMFIALALVVGGVSSCGGGSNQKAPPIPTGTPAGASSITVSATSGTTTHTSVVTLVVQ